MTPTPAPTDADKRHHGWWMRRHFWTPEVKAKVEPILRTNTRMARYAARRAKTEFPGADYPDLLSEALYAVARHAVAFDPDRGLKFGTFALRGVCKAARDLAVRQANAQRSRGVRTTPMHAHHGASQQRDGILKDLIAAEDAAWARAKIDELEGRERVVVGMRLDGDGYEAIGREVGMSAAGARLVFERAVERMGRAWRLRAVG